MRLFAALVLLCWSGVALAASDPCAKYADADAYNYCLAGSGPVARHRPASKMAPEPESAGEHRPVSRRASAARVSGRHFPAGMSQKPSRGGRVHFQILPP